MSDQVEKVDLNRMAEELRMSRLLSESRRIAERNDADGTWVSSEEMRERMAKHGVGKYLERGGYGGL